MPPAIAGSASDPTFTPAGRCSSCNGCSIATPSGPGVAALSSCGGDAVVSLWRGKRLLGFGRATSDSFSRAVLWDIVVVGDLHSPQQTNQRCRAKGR